MIRIVHDIHSMDVSIVADVIWKNPQRIHGTLAGFYDPELAPRLVEEDASLDRNPRVINS